MKKSVEMPARPAQEKKPTKPFAQKPTTERNKPYGEPVEREQKKPVPTPSRTPDVEGDEYVESVHPDIHTGDHRPDEKPW